LTSQRSIRPGLKRVSGWAGLGRAGPDTWHVMTQPRHGHGLLLGCGPWLAVYGGPRDAGPWTADWSTVDRVHPLSPRRGPCTPGACVGGRRGGVFPCSLPGGLHVGGELAVSPRGGAGVRLGRGIVPSHHSDCDGGVKVVAKASQGAGHGERRLKLHRCAGMARCCGIGRFCGARGRHNAPTGMLGRSRGPPGPLVALATVDGLPILSAASVWWLWPRRASQWGV